MMARIVSIGGSSLGTRILLEGGGELQGVSKVVFTAQVDDLTKIDAEISLAEIEADGKLTVWAANPQTGELGALSGMTFQDGTEWKAP